MTSEAEIKLLTEILNLESVRVTKYQKLSGIGLILHLESLTREASCDCAPRTPSASLWKEKSKDTSKSSIFNQRFTNKKNF